jgi:hypothetical protein
MKLRPDDDSNDENGVLLIQYKSKMKGMKHIKKVKFICEMTNDSVMSTNSRYSSVENDTSVRISENDKTMS